MPADPPPSSRPVWLLRAEEMQAWDRHATEIRGIPERLLMESAGRAAAAVVATLFPEGRVAAAVGRGNNGGDAVVLLRVLRAWGREVVAVPAEDVEPPEALLHGWEIPVARDGAEAAFRDAAVLVDGILGTGARGAPRTPQAALVRALNDAGRPVVALDGPTGVDLTTGRVEGGAVRARLTVTFGAPKRGLLLFPGREHAGRIVTVEVGFPPLDTAGAAVITTAWARPRIPRVAPDAHKGEAGMVAVVAGRRGVGGAAILAAMGALRAGSGGVYVVSDDANRSAVHAAVPEARFADRDRPEAEEVLAACDAVVVGPGIGTDPRAAELLRRCMDAAEVPVLLDADALTLLSRDPSLLPAAGRERLLLTPHPGEMGRLLGVPTGEVTADPFGALSGAVDRYGCAVLLKGAPSLVGAPGEVSLASVAGHSGIATGGMGDTLAGVAGALLGMGVAPREAAALGLFLSGRAAEWAGRGRSLLPRDVADSLPAALAADPPVPRLELPGVLLDLPAPV